LKERWKTKDGGGKFLVGKYYAEDYKSDGCPGIERMKISPASVPLIGDEAGL